MASFIRDSSGPVVAAAPALEIPVDTLQSSLLSLSVLTNLALGI